jgi:mono/diheme cytochrome c family protein
MKRTLATGALALACAAAPGPAAAQGAADAKRGEYLARAGGCVGCHTSTAKDAPPFAGGRELKTPFGTFYGPNITPHPQAGIGRWTEADFIRAMREGTGPGGSHYYPAFPFPSYTRITDADLRDLWAFLKTLPPNPQPSRAHDLRFPYGFRFPLAGWKWLYFTPGPFVPDPKASPAVNRGAYLVQALGHCGECHTPRNALGAPRRDRFLAGGKTPEGKTVANLTPTRLKRWSDAELKEFLTTGTKPDDKMAGEAMGEVVANTTSKLTPEDLAALIAYLRTLPPLPEEAP